MHGIRLIRALTPSIPEPTLQWDRYVPQGPPTAIYVSGPKAKPFFPDDPPEPAWVTATCRRLEAVRAAKARHWRMLLDREDA